MRKFLTLAIFLFLINLSSKAQLPEMYSQYMFNRLSINPAYAGAKEALSITALHREQWQNLNGNTPVTNSLNFHTPVSNKKIAIGMNIIHDKIGVTENLDLVGDYAYRIPFYKGKLSLGLQGGVLFSHNNWSQVKTNKKGDEAFMRNATEFFPKFGFGAFYFDKKIEFGVSFPHLTHFENKSRLNNSLYYNPLFIYGSYSFGIGKGFKLKPSFLMKSIKTSSIQIDINTMCEYKNIISTGLSFRSNNSLVGLLKYNVNQQWGIGYSYDYSISGIGNKNAVSHELMVNYTFKYPSKAVDLKTFN